MSDDGRGPDLHLSQPGVCFQGQTPRTGCQVELQFSGEKGKASCVSWEERNLVLMGGQTWAPWSSGQVPEDSPSPCLLPEPWFRNCPGSPCHYRASSVTLADLSVVTVIFPMGGCRQG